MDKTDKEIIKQMRKNSRIPFYKVAENLDLAVDTVIRRYKKMIKKGDIKVSARINFRKFRIVASVWYFITLKTHDDIYKVVNKLSKIKGVVIIHTVIGDYDILIETITNGYKHTLEMEKQILAIKGIYKVVGYHYLMPSNNLDLPLPLNRPWETSWIMQDKKLKDEK